MTRICMVIVTLVGVLASCAPRKSLPPPFPPADAAALQRFTEYYAPSIEIIPTGKAVLAARVPRSGAYQGLSTFFFAYPCSAYGARRLLRTGSERDNSIKIQTPSIVIARDIGELGRHLTSRPQDMIRTSTFPTGKSFFMRIAAIQVLACIES